ncbi:MAG: hypothetical protein OHK0039_14930 [Bacteroidia bacterium]
MNTTTPAYIRLRRLHCHRESSRWRKTEPYLWNIFFCIDGQSVQLNERFELSGEARFYCSPGSHGNLGVASVQAGESVLIPPAVGQWTFDMRPIAAYFTYSIPPIVGVISVLMEKENVSAAGAEAGHRALNAYVQAAVNEALRNFDVRRIDVENIRESIRQYFAEKVGEVVLGIEQAVSKAVADAQTLFQNLWPLLDRDDLVGYRIWDFHANEIAQHVALSHRWDTRSCGDWELHGEIGPGSPDPLPVTDVPIA